MQTRRQFMIRGGKLVAAAAAATAAGPTVFSRDVRAAGQLKVLLWSHFVPAYDAWFDPWAKKWGAAKGIEVSVDHVGFADVVPRATADVAAQSGHDIHMFIGLASAYEEHRSISRTSTSCSRRNTGPRSSWPSGARTIRIPRSTS